MLFFIKYFYTTITTLLSFGDRIVSHKKQKKKLQKTKIIENP